VNLVARKGGEIIKQSNNGINRYSHAEVAEKVTKM